MRIILSILVILLQIPICAMAIDFDVVPTITEIQEKLEGGTDAGDLVVVQEDAEGNQYIPFGDVLTEVTYSDEDCVVNRLYINQDGNIVKCTASGDLDLAATISDWTNLTPTDTTPPVASLFATDTTGLSFSFTSSETATVDCTQLTATLATAGTIANFTGTSSPCTTVTPVYSGDTGTMAGAEGFLIDTALNSSIVFSGLTIDNSANTATAPTYEVGGTVSGLTAFDGVLQNNAGDNLTLAADGTITFATELDDLATYLVTVLTQPTGQTCTVTNGSGTIASADVTNVSVACSDLVVGCQSAILDSAGNTVSLCEDFTAGTSGVDCDGVGASTSTNCWNVADSSSDFDFDTEGEAESATLLRYNVAENGSYYAVFEYTPTTSTGSEVFLRLYGGGSNVAYFDHRSGGFLRAVSGSVTAITTGALTVGNTYYIWAGGIGGTGSDGYAYVAFSTDKTKPALCDPSGATCSGAGSAVVANGTDTGVIDRAYFQGSTDLVYTLGDVRINTTDFGSDWD